MPSPPDPMESASLFVACVQTIEPLFSDFKSRGFGLEDSQIRLPGRLDRLILVMALALFWAGSTGMWDAAHRAGPLNPHPRAVGLKAGIDGRLAGLLGLGGGRPRLQG